MRPEQIPYGVKDFKRIRLEDFYYVDKTAFIRRLEARANFLFFVRPRRFGKSLLCETLRCYYDVAEKVNFDRLFGGLDIGRNPTANASRYFVLSFDFSFVGRCEGKNWSEKFARYLDLSLESFIRAHADVLAKDPDGRGMLEKVGADAKYDAIVSAARRLGLGVYVIVDEYDNFTNEIVSTAGKVPYKEITHGTGFYRGWFKLFKGTCDRIFMTGVSPVTMDDLTSGFNIATNITQEEEFNAMVGFTAAETRHLFEDFQGTGRFADAAEGHLRTVKAWYDSYCFSRPCAGRETLYNCDMALYYLGKLVASGRPPENLIDANIRSDWNKLRAILAAQRHAETYEGVLPLMEQLVRGEEVSFPLADCFPFDDICDEKYFKSLYYYYGIVTVSRVWRGNLQFRIPNESVRSGIAGCMREAVKDVFDAEGACEAMGCKHGLPGWPDAFGRACRDFFDTRPVQKVRTLSLFSGAGGLDIGFSDAGFEIVDAVEIERKFCDTLELNTGKGKRFANSRVNCIDIREFSGHRLGKIDFIVGGPPCQTFSAAGRRANGVLGTTDARGVLFREYVRLLKELRPKGFLFENVYGLTGAQGGKAWREIQDSFAEVGYRIFSRVLDAADYGVPQHRERLIIVGVREGEYKFPRPTHGPDSLAKTPYYNAGTAIRGLALTEEEQKPGLGGRFGHLLKGLKARGFDRADLNAGCPFPMIRRRGCGSGLFRAPDVLERLLAAGCDEMGPGRFSLKTRLGLERTDELLALMPRINRYPLAVLTVHARTAHQMYTDACDLAAFASVAAASTNPRHVQWGLGGGRRAARAPRDGRAVVHPLARRAGGRGRPAGAVHRSLVRGAVWRQARPRAHEGTDFVLDGDSALASPLAPRQDLPHGRGAAGRLPPPAGRHGAWRFGILCAGGRRFWKAPCGLDRAVRPGLRAARRGGRLLIQRGVRCFLQGSSAGPDLPPWRRWRPPTPRPSRCGSIFQGRRARCCRSMA